MVPTMMGKELHIPVKVGSLPSGVHHPVDCAAATKSTAGGDLQQISSLRALPKQAKSWTYNRASIRQLRTLVALPEQGEVARREQIPWIQCWMYDLRLLEVVRTLLYHKN